MDNLQFLNHELTAFGFPAPIRLPEGFDEENAQILQCITALLQQRQRDVDYREEVDDKYRRLMSEQETLLHNMTKLRNDMEAVERTLDSTKSKLSISEASLKDLNEKHRNVKEELKTAKNNLQYTRTQYTHDLRKREQDKTRMNDKMQRMAADKFKASKMGLQMLNPFVKEKTLLSKDKVKDKELIDIVLANYEEREQELLDEIEMMRHSMYDLYVAIAEAKQSNANDGNAPDPEPTDDGSGADGPRVYREKVFLPYELVKQRMGTDVKQLVDDIKDDWQSFTQRSQLPPPADPAVLAEKDRKITSLEAQIALLEEKVASYKKVIDEQNRVIEMSLNPVLNQRRRDSGLVGMQMQDSDADSVADERNALQRQKELLEEERRKFTEAAIRLGKEREELRNEKEQFEREKENDQVHALLKNLPSTPHYLKHVDLNESTPEILKRIQAANDQMMNGQGALANGDGPTWPDHEYSDSHAAHLATLSDDQDAITTTNDYHSHPHHGGMAPDTPLRSRSQASSVRSPTSPRSPSTTRTYSSLSRATAPTVSTVHRRMARRPSVATTVVSPESPERRGSIGNNALKKVAVRTPAEIRHHVDKGPCTRASCSSHHHKPPIAPVSNAAGTRSRKASMPTVSPTKDLPTRRSLSRSSYDAEISSIAHSSRPRTQSRGQ
ncbi:hypothetical protein H4R35_005136 [Dimargaris xerosporica]|nr:hypothetical protein H4R35_005136 [Dimargaris xerosporica]